MALHRDLRLYVSVTSELAVWVLNSMGDAKIWCLSGIEASYMHAVLQGY